MKTVVTYQSFGYGPVMKVVKFLADANTQIDGEVVLIADQKDRHLLVPNTHLFEKVKVTYAATQEEKFATLYSLLPISNIISFNDYESIVWGYFQNVPRRITVDGLFHLWLINEHDLQDQKARYLYNKQQTFGHMQRLASRLFGENPHEVIIWKHYFATHSFIGNYKGAHEKAVNFQKHHLLHCAGYFDFMPLPQCIVNTPPAKQKLLMINFGGGCYPTMTLAEEKRYCDLAVRAVKEYVTVLETELEFATKIALVHPTLLGHVSSLLHDPSYIVLASPSMQGYARILNHADILITAPGNTAVFEAAHQGKLVFLLPEKHIEQINFVGLVQDSFISSSIYEYVPDKTYAISSEQGSVEMLMSAANRVLEDKNLRLINKEKVLEALNSKDAHIDRQKACLASMYGQNNGAKQLAQGILQIISESDRTSPQKLRASQKVGQI